MPIQRPRENIKSAKPHQFIAHCIRAIVSQKDYTRPRTRRTQSTQSLRPGTPIQIQVAQDNWGQRPAFGRSGLFERIEVDQAPGGFS